MARIEPNLNRVPRDMTGRDFDRLFQNLMLTVGCVTLIVIIAIGLMAIVVIAAVGRWVL